MEIIAVDDEYLSLEALQSAIRKAAPEAAIHGFRSADDALVYAQNAEIDIAFLDIRMRGSSGLDLAEKLKERNPDINLVFITGFSEYMKDAFRLHASGYILKPVTPDKVRNELENLRRPVSAKEAPQLAIRTFGFFEVFVNSHPLTFDYSKTRELLAYLVNANGAMCSLARVVDALWEDGQGMAVHGSYMRNLVSDLQRVLRENGCEDILLRKRGYVGIDRNRVQCDYYDYLDGKESGLHAFHGEYMSQYSWGEVTLATLMGQMR